MTYRDQLIIVIRAIKKIAGEHKSRRKCLSALTAVDLSALSFGERTKKEKN